MLWRIFARILAWLGPHGASLGDEMDNAPEPDAVDRRPDGLPS